MIRIQLRERNQSYEVQPRGLNDVLDKLDDHDVVVTDENLLRCYPQIIERASRLVAVAPGEQSKSFSSYRDCVSRVLSSGLKRSGRIVAIGGGVIGDLAGFVAASVHRGVELVQVPTSLLAMVDSSVGGKVGIDLPEGKNLLGAFKNPSSVELDLEVLRTLPEEQFVNGMAEILKYGWIFDTDLLHVLGSEKLSINSERLGQVVWRCIEIKRDVVEADFEEQNGLRAILNFGHTVGHALETLDGYSSLLHGQAISIGMVAEAAIAEGLGISELEPEQVAASFVKYGLPVSPTQRVDVDALIELMMGDKKNVGRGLSMSLVTVPGECKLIHGLDPVRVRTVLADLWK